MTKHNAFTVQPARTSHRIITQKSVTVTITGMQTYQSVRVVQRKNCEPFVLAPEFAIDKVPGFVCFKVKFSSSNFFPYIDLPPVPLWLVKSPPWHI
jgi:hypothetical protein